MRRNTRKIWPSSSSSSTTSTSTTVTYTFPSDHNSTPHQKIPIIIHPPPPAATATTTAAARIQAAYRSHVVRRLVRKISAIKAEVDRLETLIQRQETVDLVRSNEKEKVRINEALMGQLLELDSVPGSGFDPGVRELRRSVSRRIVGLQEVMDGICGERLRMDGCDGLVWREWNWDEMVEEMEEDVCRERGGEELERFCALNLGFRCLQRFLSQP